RTPAAARLAARRRRWGDGRPLPEPARPPGRTPRERLRRRGTAARATEGIVGSQQRDPTGPPVADQHLHRSTAGCVRPSGVSSRPRALQLRPVLVHPPQHLCPGVAISATWYAKKPAPPSSGPRGAGIPGCNGTMVPGRFVLFGTLPLQVRRRVGVLGGTRRAFE